MTNDELLRALVPRVRIMVPAMVDEIEALLLDNTTDKVADFCRRYSDALFAMVEANLQPLR